MPGVHGCRWVVGDDRQRGFDAAACRPDRCGGDILGDLCAVRVVVSPSRSCVHLVKGWLWERSCVDDRGAHPVVVLVAQYLLSFAPSSSLKYLVSFAVYAMNAVE